MNRIYQHISPCKGGYSNGARRVMRYFDKQGTPYEVLDINRDNLSFHQFLQWLHHAEDPMKLFNTGARAKAALKEEEVELEDLSMTTLYYAVIRHPYLLRDPITWNGKAILAGSDKDELTVFHTREQKEESFAPYLQLT